jgi:muconolactone D-isomerase
MERTDVEFMVFIKNNHPSPVNSKDEIIFNELLEAEAIRAKELNADGTLMRLWRRVGQPGNVGIWESDSPESLKKAISTLPFSKWLNVEIWPLSEHPNDPLFGKLKTREEK